MCHCGGSCVQPRDHHTIKADLFKTVERELVFDIDLSDYDDVCSTHVMLLRWPTN